MWLYGSLIEDTSFLNFSSSSQSQLQLVLINPKNYSPKKEKQHIYFRLSKFIFRYGSSQLKGAMKSLIFVRSEIN